MIFNSLEFLIFIVLFFLAWPWLKKYNYTRWTFLVVSSFIFYAWWDWRFLFLLIGSGLIDFFAGLGIAKRPKYRTTFLVTSIVMNLGMLSIFKYSTFFAIVIEDFLSIVGISLQLTDNIPEFALILPVGISFYTFQSLSYTVDIYRGRLKPTKNVLHFFSYLVMFPQLVAGPIVRAKDFLNQLKSYKTVDSITIWNGLKLIAFGLFQKLVIADNLSYLIDSAYQGVSIFDGTVYWWIIAVAFSFQIYCDFSGYSLIARGLAKLMGYHFKMNFNHPYLATSFKSFWSRWHISLSTWFRDYVYIPLGGSKKGFWTGVIALVITFLLSGIWHGPNYTFVMWAAIHVTLLIIERLFNRVNKNFNIKLKSYFSWFAGVKILFVFALTSIAWVYFRSDSIQQANEIVGKLFRLNPTKTEFWKVHEANLFYLKWAFIIEIAVLINRKSFVIRSVIRKLNLDVIAFVVAVIAVLFLRGEGKQFIYFQF